LVRFGIPRIAQTAPVCSREMTFYRHSRSAEGLINDGRCCLTLGSNASSRLYNEAFRKMLRLKSHIEDLGLGSGKYGKIWPAFLGSTDYEISSVVYSLKLILTSHVLSFCTIFIDLQCTSNSAGIFGDHVQTFYRLCMRDESIDSCSHK
jgi:hypothetical protein